MVACVRILSKYWFITPRMVMLVWERMLGVFYSDIKVCVCSVWLLGYTLHFMALTTYFLTRKVLWKVAWSWLWEAMSVNL